MLVRLATSLVLGWIMMRPRQSTPPSPPFTPGEVPPVDMPTYIPGGPSGVPPVEMPTYIPGHAHGVPPVDMPTFDPDHSVPPTPPPGYDGAWPAEPGGSEHRVPPTPPPGYDGEWPPVSKHPHRITGMRLLDWIRDVFRARQVRGANVPGADVYGGGAVAKTSRTDSNGKA